MKHKVFIAKVLTIGIVLNSLSVLSYANTEIPNRYQTLEGEFITIDDSTEGNLEEIEIFGNTMQNEDDLNDIQSAGDLYVDEDGNPILDKQGRKQYKIDIISQKNIVKTFYNGTAKNIGSNIYKMAINPQAYSFVVFSPTDISIGDVINVEFEILSIDDEIKNTNIILNMANSAFTDRNIYANKELGKQKFQYTVNKLPNNAGIPSNSIRLVDLTFPIVQDIVGKEMTFKINIYKESASHKETILLPCQLQKVGYLSDRLYWDSEKGKYLIEKNVDTFKLEELGPYEVTTYGALKEYWSYTWNDVGLLRGYKYQSPIISNYNTTNKDKTYLNYWTNNLRLLTKPGIVKEGAVSADDMTLADYLDYANTNNIFNPDTVVMILREKPIYMDTNITSKLKVPTYDEKTHLYIDSENEISSSLKVVVDRLPQIARDAVLEAEINSSINNISLARMYVNMLPESLYKDQLQEQLSEIFSSDIALDKKTTTANLDLYIKSENILIMSLSTNSITFEDFSGVEDMVKENAVQISINSSLPYSLNAYLPTEIQNSDKSNTMDKQILNIKENSESTYQTFVNTTDKIVLKDNNSAGNDLIHNIDIKLKGGIAHQKDVYKTTIKFEAEQK